MTTSITSNPSYSALTHNGIEVVKYDNSGLQAASIPDTSITNAKLSLSANASNVMTALNATGSAPIYACRAWVNFNGTGTVAIRASGNVSSITDNGIGSYTVNFTTAFPDANYVPTGQGSNVATEGRFQFENGAARTSSAYRFVTVDSGQAPSDSTYVSVAFFR